MGTLCRSQQLGAASLAGDGPTDLHAALLHHAPLYFATLVLAAPRPPLQAVLLLHNTLGVAVTKDVPTLGANGGVHTLRNPPTVV
eukprot:CAMPEP_0177781978 /NCGR_PEP_ID=MMETSP0491_2-20121128/18175_1 /TAXON_ID=63592 /ORGANISM="Tetraselmis chuii, Strain PLY429" /LENGTH=84 /DNA_ID=CAMNT_0019302153 /DNA_START=206 /DNA_END=456 /DNA_ORIENTATION=-